MKQKQFGFSLIELLVVIVIMAILATISIGTFTDFFTQADDSKRISNVTLISNLIKANDATIWDDTKYVKNSTQIKAILNANDVTLPSSSSSEEICYFYGYAQKDGTAGTDGNPDNNQYFVATWGEKESKPIVAGSLHGVALLDKTGYTSTGFTCDLSSIGGGLVGSSSGFVNGSFVITKIQ